MRRAASGYGALCHVSIFVLVFSFTEGLLCAKDGMCIKSPSFENGKEIPIEYTCEGRNLTIPLEWSNVPPGTKSLVLLVDDPDAPNPEKPKMVWVHWILYDVPPGIGSLPKGPRDTGLPKGTRQGLNSWKNKVWSGPCPPIGRHRYFFKLFALDKVMGDLHEPNEKRLMKAIEGHILEKAVYMGTYKKKTNEK